MKPNIKPKYKNINRFFKVIDRSLFRIDTKLSYERTLIAIEKLCQEISNVDTDEDVWCIGEFDSASLDNLLVGTYWFLTSYISENSIEDRVRSCIGEIFFPNMSCGPEPGSSEEYVYEVWETKRADN